MKYTINVEVELTDHQAEAYMKGQNMSEKSTWWDAACLRIWVQAANQVQHQFEANRTPQIGDLIQEMNWDWVPKMGDKCTWVYLGKDHLGNRYARTEPEGRVFQILGDKQIRVDQRKHS